MVGLAMGFAVAFSRDFLTARTLMPRTGRLMLGAMYFPIGLAVLSNFVAYSIIVRLLVLAGIVSFGLVLFAGVLGYRLGYKPARIFLVSWCFFILGSIVFALKTAGVLPNAFLTAYSMQIGSS